MDVVDQSHNNKYTADRGGTLNIHYGVALSPTASGPGMSAGSIRRSHRRCPAPSSKYTHRQTIESHMSSYFSDSGWGRKCYVLHGPGAVGKTQLALSFIHNNFYSVRPKQRRFSQVCWVDATTVDSINRSLEDFAQSVGAGSTAESAIDWLAQCDDDDDSNWIMVFNDADDPNLGLATFFPDCSHGNILITTRNYQSKRYGSGSGSDCLVTGMTEEEGVGLLLKHLQVEDSTHPSIISDATALVQKLNYFALSIAQTGTYIHTTPCTIKECIDSLLSRPEQLLHELDQIQNPDGYKYGTIGAAWSSSYAKLGPTTKHLLRLFACMNPDNIKQELFQNLCSGLEQYETQYLPFFTEEEANAIASLKEFRGNVATNGCWDVSKFRKLIKDLQSHSFTSFTLGSATFSLHPVLHEVARSPLFTDGSTLFHHCTIILLGISAMLNRGDSSSLQWLVPHVNEALNGLGLSFDGCRNEFGFVFESIGRYSDGVNLRRSYKETCERILGRDHPRTLTSLVDLARIYRSQGRFDETEPLLLQVVEGRKKQLGVDHIDTLQSTHELSETYFAQRRFDEAEQLQLQVVESRKRQLGDNDPDTHSSLHNLAQIYWGQGRLDKAEPIQKDIVAHRKERLGADHLDTLSSIASLAATYHSQKRLYEAETLQLQVVEARKKLLGPNHLDTLSSVHDLGLTYWSQGRFDEAEQLQFEAVESRKKSLGASHLHTISSMNNLGMTYYSKGRLDEAERLQLEVVEGRKKRLGPEHLYTLSSIHNLALIYHKQGRFDDSEPLLSQVVEGRKKRLGASHPDTLDSINWLAIASRSQGRIRRALELDLQVMRNQPHQTETPDSSRPVPIILPDQEALKQVETYVGESLKAYEKQLRTKHRDIIDAVKLLSKLKL